MCLLPEFVVVPMYISPPKYIRYQVSLLEDPAQTNYRQNTITSFYFLRLLFVVYKLVISVLIKCYHGSFISIPSFIIGGLTIRKLRHKNRQINWDGVSVLDCGPYTRSRKIPTKKSKFPIFGIPFFALRLVPPFSQFLLPKVVCCCLQTCIFLF